LHIPAASLNFGEVWENAEFVWVVPIENRSAQEVRITDFSSSCTCSKIEPSKLTIPAGESRKVAMTLDLTGAKTAEDYRKAVRDFAVSIEPRCEPSVGKVNWKIRGRIRVPFVFEQPRLDLGRHSELAQPLPPCKVALTGLVSLAKMTSKTTSPHFQAHIQRTAAPDRFELILTPVKPLPCGFHTFEVQVFPHLADGKELPGKTLPVRVRVESDLQTTPPVVVFGARPLGETAEEVLTLRSLTGQSFEVLGVKALGDGLTVERAHEGAAGTAYQLRQQVVKTQAQHGQVVFCVRTARAGEEDLAVPVSYHGIAATTK
jgi:hypothetical protein